MSATLQHGRYRFVGLQNEDSRTFGQAVADIYAAAANEGATVVHVSSGVSVMDPGNAPEHWAHIVVFQPPTIAKDEPPDILGTLQMTASA